MLRFPLAVLSAALLLPACKKDRQQGVPLTAVDVQINVNLPAYNDLTAPGGWAYITGGSMGLLVYRASIDEFVAMDRHCPYQPQNLCHVTVEDNDVLARDTTCCHSSFLVSTGGVVDGPAAIGLTRYHTSFNGTILRIYN